jgi:hypothetical protein
MKLQFVTSFALVVATLAGCAAPVNSPVVENTATGQAELPIVHECSSRSSIQVGAYTTQWANWSLTVDASNFAYVTVTTDAGVTVEAHGGMPLVVRFPGDSVDFTISEENARATFMQPYPGLVHGYSVEVPCAK